MRVSGIRDQGSGAPQNRGLHVKGKTEHGIAKTMVSLGQNFVNWDLEARILLEAVPPAEAWETSAGAALRVPGTAAISLASIPEKEHENASG